MDVCWESPGGLAGCLYTLAFATLAVRAGGGIDALAVTGKSHDLDLEWRD